MNDYFTQIPIQIKTFDISKSELTPRRKFQKTENSNSNELAPAYYSSINNIEYANYLNTIFKELNPRDVFYCQFSGSAPHFDHDDSKCAINHYYITQNATTLFHEPKDNAVPFCGVGEKTANYYHPNDIIEADSFCAEPNSVWLLNVAKVHSLKFPGEHGPLRSFIKWRFDSSYEEIYQRLFNEILPKL